MVTRNYILPIGDTLTILYDEIVERIPCFTNIVNNEDRTVISGNVKFIGYSLYDSVGTGKKTITLETETTGDGENAVLTVKGLSADNYVIVPGNTSTFNVLSIDDPDTLIGVII